MKSFQFRALLLGALLFSTGLRGQSTPADLVRSIITGTQAATTGSETYALNMALSGTTSSPIDLRSASGMLVSITGTGTALSGIEVQWNYVSYTAATWFGGGQIPAKTHQFVTKQAKWARFRVLDSSDATGKTTVFYSVPDLASLGTVTLASGSVVNLGTGGISVTAGSNPWPVTGTVVANQGTAGSAQWPVDAKGSSVNASGFNFLSFTTLSGVTGNADTVLSITWAASTTTGPIFVDINCGGAAGDNFLITNGSSTPAGFVANAALAGYQPCGQISQVPLEVNAADNPHLHLVASGLSFTSGTVGVTTKKRP